MTTRSCLDCRHCKHDAVRGYMCMKHYELTQESQTEIIEAQRVYATPSQLHLVRSHCHTARTDEHLCGPEGKNWESKV